MVETNANSRRRGPTRKSNNPKQLFEIGAFAQMGKRIAQLGNFLVENFHVIVVAPPNAMVVRRLLQRDLRFAGVAHTVPCEVNRE